MLATPDYQLIHDALDYDHHAVSIAHGEGFATVLRARDRVPAARLPDLPRRRLLSSSASRPAERVEAARLANALVGTGIVALIG